MRTKQWFTVQQIHPFAYAIAEFCHFEKVLSYLLIGNREAVLIDTGMGYASINTIVRQLTRLPVNVLLTHTHWDHIGGVGLFQNPMVYYEKSELDRLKKGFHSAQISELRDPNMFEKPFGPRAFSVAGVSAEKIVHSQVLVYEPFRLHVWHTPGHTRGSVCFFEETIGALFAGDTLYPGPLYAFDSDANLDHYHDSLRYINSHIDAIKVVHPGHNTAHEPPSIITRANMMFDVVKNRTASGSNKTGNVVEYSGEGVSLITTTAHLVSYRR